MWGYIWLLARKIFRAVARLLACEIRSGPCPQIGSCIEVYRLFFDFEAITIQNHLISSETMVPMTLIGGGTRGVLVSAQRYLGRLQISILKGKISRFREVWTIDAGKQSSKRFNRSKQALEYS